MLAGQLFQLILESLEEDVNFEVELFLDFRRRLCCLDRCSRCRLEATTASSLLAVREHIDKRFDLDLGLESCVFLEVKTHLVKVGRRWFSLGTTGESHYVLNGLLFSNR